MNPVTTWAGQTAKSGGDVPQRASDPIPLLSQDNLFHPFSKSPFPAVRARGEAIRSLAPCPVCSEDHGSDLEFPKPFPKAVGFDCPNCGWPTHCSEEHWRMDKEHEKYCSRLREVNEDEHDLRSGRRLREFELPGEQDRDAAISFSNWDVFWYTRSFPSMDTDRSRRHASKLLTYPITIASVLHQYSSLTISNQRLTVEGSRSLAALRYTLHGPSGTPETSEQSVNKPKMRIFILGARHESALPPHTWEQLCKCFPAALFHLYFIGPQVSLPLPPQSELKVKQEAEAKARAESEEKTRREGKPAPSSPVEKSEKPVYVPNVYQPPTPPAISREKRTRNSMQKYGVPSYTVPFTYQLTITGMQCKYDEVHAHFADTFDPYTDAFFLFMPGLGFPSMTSTSDSGEPLLQAASPTEWGPVLPLLLSTKCPIFVTGFSPTDVERDVRSLSMTSGIAGEFDWVVTPGENPFGSLKWEAADFDPRVMIKTNWGVWGIRGKRRELLERSFFGFKY
ncbi:zinc-finger of mitochondrial splicing suppressor 51-domain-containing protein [Vararia minispora EC-137]|uniref:Zinc-finger of mitochondrial splicing suppressor 51-domain-containing protein n=1 Tax=Vararia minispora EC-137 TaxID=1314806 RepID=A0ACB8QV43_9AGAM|nr:zinc-finger of mitochondrial splicing suppressor 51-domain-containing protein [Vararia minispora EC-137]